MNEVSAKFEPTTNGVGFRSIASAAQKQSIVKFYLGRLARNCGYTQIVICNLAQDLMKSCIIIAFLVCLSQNALLAQEHIDRADSLAVLKFWKDVETVVYRHDTLALRSLMSDNFGCWPCFDGVDFEGPGPHDISIASSFFLSRFFDEVFDSTMVTVMKQDEPRAAIFFDTFCVVYTKIKPRHECDGMNAIFVVDRKGSTFQFAGYTSVP